MITETKYNIGHEVWFLEDNQVKNGKVTGLKFSYGIGEYFGTSSQKENIQVNYFIRGEYICSGRILEEKFLFPTKAELLKSL